MKRLRVILLFLLLGAIVNVAVAWGIAIFWASIPDEKTQRSVFYSGYGERYQNWRVVLVSKAGGARLRSDWTITVLSYYAEGPSPFKDSKDVIPWWGEYAYPSGISYDPGERTRTIDVRGWPVLSMWTGQEQRYNLELPSGISCQSHKIIAGYQIPSKLVNPNSGKPVILVLPLRPLWTGFAINTIFYAAIFWLLIPGPFVLRRAIRRKHGLCVKCAYDLRGADHEACPECGAEVPLQ
ncbi:MAG: hypothetical protein IID30_14045 [Planctomycetes bacterium]|nr:hypothetical protein [Planctomycetota bacterium]